MKNGFSHRAFGISGIFLLLALTFYPVRSISVGQNNEDEVKALFVLSFIKYITWPTEIDKGKVSIGVVGESEVYNSLRDVISKRTANNGIMVERAEMQSNKDFNIVYVSQEETEHLDKWITKYSGKGVLIISEKCRRSCGAAINLIIVDNRIKFEINQTGALRGGIKISSKLLELAATVHP